MSDYVGLFEDSEMENKAFKKIHLVRNFTINTSIEYSKHDSMYWLQNMLKYALQKYCYTYWNTFIPIKLKHEK